jgi:hypothetical protein
MSLLDNERESNLKLTTKDYDQILEWAGQAQIGVSSNTILFAITGKSVYGISRDIPCDWSDFNRCMKLIKSVEIIEKNLPIVAEIYPKWIPIIREWDKLVKAWKVRDGFYDVIKSLRDECYICDGYEKITEGHWQRKK